MATNVVSVEETNHLRAVYICYRVAPEAVRAYFDSRHPPIQLVGDLARESSDLQKIKTKKILKQFQWDQLYPSTGSPSPVSLDFDVTLLVCLLRNMNPKILPPPFGFDDLPHSSHTGEGAHIARIKYYRNRLAHSTDGKLLNTEFIDLWNDLELAIIGLGGSQFSQEINNAKTISLDNTLPEILRQLTEYEKQHEELSVNVTSNLKKINHLNTAIENLSTEQTAIKEDYEQNIFDVIEDIRKQEHNMVEISTTVKELEGQMSKLRNELQEVEKDIAAMKMESIPENRKELLKQWKECDAMFIRTRAADKVYTKIKNNSCLTVTGNSGMGKTMAVKHAALKMLEEGYTIVPINHPDEIVTLFSTQKNTLFVVDDLCGKYTLNQNYLDRLKIILENLKSILDKQYCKIVSSCRLPVFKDIRFTTLSIFNVCECNFNSDNLKLTSEELTLFAAKYFGKHANETVSMLKQYDYFPFICSLYHKHKSVNLDTFCKNPFQFVGEELKNLLLEGEESKYKYCVLVLCVIHNNHLTEDLLTGKIDRSTREMIEGVLEECELNRGTSPKCLHRALQTLVGTFLIKEKDSYRMLHDKLFDFVSCYFGQHMINTLIEHADSAFIRKRFLFDTSDIKEDKVDFTINIPDDVVDSYIARLIKDWANKKVMNFFSNRNLKSLVFTVKVLNHLNKLDKFRQEELVRTVDNHNHDTPLIRSCYTGNLKLTQWILQHDVNVNKGYPSPLYRASQEGYVQIVRELLQYGANINIHNLTELNDYRPPLYISCYFGHTDVVTELLKNDNANIDLCDDEGCSSLYLACLGGYVQIVRDLLQHGADINKCTQKGKSPLRTSCYCGKTDVVTELLKNDNVKIDLCDNEGCSSLHLACQKGYVQIVRKLLQHGADINKCDEDGWSPLHTACSFGHIDVVTELLKNDNVKIDLCDNKGCSSLYLACQEGYVQIVRELLQHGADINKCRQNGWSQLHTACSLRHTDVVTELLKNVNVQIDLCDNKGCSSLYLACQEGCVQIVIELLQHGADINKCDEDGWSPLYISCCFGRTDVVTELLTNDNVQIDLCGNRGDSSLHLACENGYVQIVRELLQHGADINKCDKDGLSPLHTACYYGHNDVVIELLKTDNVKIDLCDNKGCSSLYRACQKGYVQIVRDLLQHGADINKCHDHGDSPFQIACIHNYNDIVVEFLKHDVMLDLYDKDGDTALYSACEEGHTELVKLLLERGVNVNKCSNTGESPLLVSCVLGNIDIVDMLLHRDADMNLCVHSKDVYMEEIQKYQHIHSEEDKTFWTKIKNYGSLKTKEYTDGDGWIIDKTAGASPLHLACFMGHDEIVNLLLEKSPNINMTTDNGTTPLFLAIETGHEYLVTLLKTGGADAGIYRQDGKSPYRVALDNGHTSLAPMLLLKNDNVKIDECDNKGCSSLYRACQKGYVQIVRDLLQHGADINKCNYHGNSPIQIACIHNYNDIVVECLKHDVMLDLYDKDGDTALYSACEEGNAELVKLLLERGVNVNICSNTGESPLLVSCVLGNIDIVDMLLHRDADINLCVHSKDVYMEEIKKYQHIHSGKDKIFWTKIKKYGSLKTKEYTDGGGWIIDKTAGASPLHLACFIGHDEIVNLLLEKSPNINMTTDNGTTPLFLAIETGHEYLVTLLLTGGADAGIYRQDGKSPYIVALDNGHAPLASMLLR